jgi:hypothetical protein
VVGQAHGQQPRPVGHEPVAADGAEPVVRFEFAHAGFDERLVAMLGPMTADPLKCSSTLPRRWTHLLPHTPLNSEAELWPGSH